MWYRIDAKPLVSLSDAVDILDHHDVMDRKRGILEGNNVMDSLVWEMPVEPEKIEAIRKAIYEVNIVLPDSVAHLWEPGRDPIPY